MADLGETDALFESLGYLAAIIDDRAAGDAPDEPSWTRKLLDKGPAQCAKKLGEEGVEAALAVASQSDADVAAEAADLIYHLFVALRSRGVALDDVGAALAQRQGVSGVAEKAGRKSD